jgi:MFS family permease
LGEERVLPYAMILTGLGLSFLVIPGGSVILVVAGAMGGCGHGFLYPGLSALALRNEPPAIRGRITGAFTGSVDAGAFVGSIVLGFIGQWAGFQTLFLAAGGALLAAFVLYRRSRLLL